ncbi:MAG TPA: PEGA domain-containing protein [Candidatus Polarisedimenticolaceae bacterium]|nr:PEGA domain-containing protein [Candidatus Polarisedimenticolaceae bacterium]
MRFTRASLVGITLLVLGLASFPVEARSASHGRGGGGASAARPSHGGRGSYAGPQRSTAARPVASGRATATRPGGGGGAPPHHTQGKATWGHGGYYGHGGHGYPYYPYWGYPYYGYGYGYYGYPCGWWGCDPWYGWGVGLSVGWGGAYYGGGYAEPVPVPYDPAESQGPPPQGAGYPAWVETDVIPKRASVRLDGEDVGFAKDWNGVWDRLQIPSGSHVLEFALEGHQTLQVHLDAQPGRVYHIRRELQKGEGIDSRSSSEVPTAPPAAAPPAQGFLRLDVEPADAAVYLDGKFVGRASDIHLRRSRPLPSGEHSLEVVRPGYRPGRQTVVVPADDVQELRIVLEPEPGSDPGDNVSSRGSAGSSPA